MNLRFPSVAFKPNESLVIVMQDLDDSSETGEMTFTFGEEKILYTDRNSTEYSHEYQDPSLREKWHVGGLYADFSRCLIELLGKDDDKVHNRLITTAASAVWEIVKALDESARRYKSFKEGNRIDLLKLSKEKLMEAFQMARFIDSEIKDLGKDFPSLEHMAETIPLATKNLAEQYRESMVHEQALFMESANRARNEIEKAMENIRGESVGLESKLQAVMIGANQRINDLQQAHKSELEVIRDKAQVDILESQKSIKTTDAKLISLHAEAIDFVQSTIEEFKNAEAEQNEILAELKITKQHLEKLAQIRSEQALTNDFEKASDRAEKANWIWTAAFFLTGVLTIVIFGAFIFTSVGIEVYGVKIYTPPIREGIDWTRLLQRISITAVLAYILVYTGNQAAKQRNYEKYFSRLSMELKALDAYIAPYGPEKKLEFKEAFMHMYFGKVSAPLYEKESSQPSLDFLSVAAKLAEARKKEGGEDSKDGEKKTESKESNMNLSLTLSAQSTPEEQKPKDTTS